MTRVKTNSIIKVSLEGGIKLYMRKDEKASISMVKIICITLVFVLCSGIAVMAANSKINNVKIRFSNDYELNVLTTKTKVVDILKDNHIVLAEQEIAEPDLEQEIGDDKLICITKLENSNEEPEVDEVETLEMNDIKDSYSTVLEKIVTLEVEIPYETVTKDISGTNSQETTTKVIQEGENGLKIITYKITYKDDIEVDRLELETKVVKEPVDKIVQVNQKQTSRGSLNRTASANPATTATTSLAKKVENIEPKVVTLNASAYTASTCGKTNTDSGYGYTASGSKAQAWYTIAAGKSYPIGTIMYIPYFKDKPNGGWFVVQDRGSAISNSKVDIYMDSYSDCKKFGRRNLECYIYEV